MAPHYVRELRLDICSACGGVWFDAGEFGNINRRGSRALDAVVAEEPLNLTPAKDPNGPLSCPVCSVPLNRYHFAGTTAVMLAGCEKCAGIYLSHDDLVKLDERGKALEHRAPQGLTEGQAASVAMLDGEAAAAMFETKMAQYNWKQLMNPVMFS